jgi:glutaredoxin
MREIVLEELSSPGCHNCAAFKETWEGIKADWPNVTFKEVSLMDPEGQEMVQKYQIFASPGIILNGELFSTGGVDKDPFIKKLEELSKE